MGRDERNLFAFGSPFKARGAQAYSTEPAPKPEKPPDAEPTTTTAPQAIDTSGMNLLAAWPDDDGKGTAWVSDSGKTVTVSVGETLRGAQVARIEPGAVVLKSGEQEARIESRSSVRALVMRPFKTGSTGPTVRVRTQTPSASPPKPARRSLGISVRDFSAREASEARAPANARAAVSEVARTDIDVRAGDFILAVDGQEANSTAQALRLILAAQKQESVRLRLWREGREVEATVRWKE
jgi:S1-C subfamily serine protease